MRGPPEAAQATIPGRFAESLRGAADRFGTPLYLYEAERLRRDAAAIRRAFPNPGWTRLYSLKANGLPGLVARVAAEGFGASAVSRGEVDLAVRAGVPPSWIALEGVGKTEQDLRVALRLARGGTPLLWVSLESPEEAAALAAMALRRLAPGQRIDALVRLNPAVSPETHQGLAVGAEGSKFGVAPHEVGAVLEAGGEEAGPVRWRGLHVHVGSQLSSVQAWSEGVRAGLAFFAEHALDRPAFDTLDVGGGFPAPWPPGNLPAPKDFAAAARAALRDVPPRHRPARLAVEPGRAVIAAAGFLLARVLHVRERRPIRGGLGGRLVVLDAGMTELIRPALYGAEHPIFALTHHGRPVRRRHLGTMAMVDGPVCESTDRFGPALLPEVERGDLVAIGMAGAYASAMASSYNGRPRPPEVMMEPDGSFSILRRRAALRSLP